MITVKRLKELLEQLPDDAEVYAYEGEDVGIGIRQRSIPQQRHWWIRAREGSHQDDVTAGFPRNY